VSRRRWTARWRISPRRAFRVAGPTAFAEAAIIHEDVDHLMIYDAPCSQPGASFAHLAIYGLEYLGFVPRGEAGAFIAERSTASSGRLPLNTTAAALSDIIDQVLSNKVRRTRRGLQAYRLPLESAIEWARSMARAAAPAPSSSM